MNAPGGMRFAALLAASIFSVALVSATALAGTYTSLYQFTGGADGATPAFSVAYDEKGNLYGVTVQGGVGPCSLASFGCGTVYKVSPAGQETTLVAFDGVSKGGDPGGPLTLVNHTLYGNASTGGANDSGVLFSVHADGTKFRLLHTFSGRDGITPAGPLVPGPGGVFYGVTRYGGPTLKRANAGVLFELMPDGTYLHLHDFTGGADGS